jgi:hypothetical protein
VREKTSIFSAMRAMQEHHDLIARRERDKRETAYLRTLNFTDGELAAYAGRMCGIHYRLDAWRLRRSSNVS